MPRNNHTGRFLPGPLTPDELERARQVCRVPNAGSFGAPGRPGGKAVRPLGHTYIDSKSGEVMVKVGESPYNGRSYVIAATGRRYTLGRSGLYRPRRVVFFEQAYGPVPPGCVVRRLMPEPLDDRLDNLVLVTRRVNATLNSGHWCKPRRPWAAIPLDSDLRLAVVQAAVADELRRLREGAA